MPTMHSGSPVCPDLCTASWNPLPWRSYALHRGLKANEVFLRDVMARPMPQLDAGVGLEEVYRVLLAGNPAVLVNCKNRLSDLITRSDLMEFYELHKPVNGS
jgi:hypothetical protein